MGTVGGAAGRSRAWLLHSVALLSLTAEALDRNTSRFSFATQLRCVAIF